MSQPDVDVVRGAYEAFNRRDLAGFLEPLAPDVHVDMSERVFNPDTYDAHDGVRRLFGEIMDVWETFEWQLEEIVDAGGTVVALVRAQGKGRGSGVETDRRIAFTWELRDGKATLIRLYVDRERALQAAGVPTRGAPPGRGSSQG